MWKSLASALVLFSLSFDFVDGSQDCPKDYTVSSSGNILHDLKTSWQIDDDIEKDARHLAIAIAVAGKDAQVLDNVIRGASISVCELPKQVVINTYPIIGESAGPNTSTVTVTEDMLGEYELDTRVWPVIFHAAVEEIRKGPSVLFKDERNLFECKDNTKALCNLGTYISRMSGESIIATRMDQEGSIQVWRPIMKHAAGEMVSLWSTSGDRRIVKNFTDLGDDSTFFYYNTDPDEGDVHGSLSVTDAIGEETYILYPTSMRRHLDG